MTEALTPQMKNLSVDVFKATGLKPLPGKMRPPRTIEGKKVPIASNMRKLTLNPNQPIFKYDISIKTVNKKTDGTEGSFEISKSSKSRADHEQDKVFCHRVYERAVRECPELRKGGPFFYDRQASLYSLTRITDELKFSARGADLSPREGFIRADFTLKKVQQSFQTTSNDVPVTVNLSPALADRTLLEALNLIISAPAIDNPNVLTINNCVHYLYNDAPATVQSVNGTGGKCSAVGAKKSVKTLEGKEGKPTLYMTTELKTTFFHPDNATLLQVLSDYPGFRNDLPANCSFVLNNRHAFIGLKLFRHYGKNTTLGEDGSILRVKGFGLPANQQSFLFNGVETTVEQYFLNKYNIKLQFPKLFTIEAKGKFSNSEFVPVEVLNVVNGQVVTTEQMSPKEQEALVKLSANKPHVRKTTTEQVVNSVGIASNTIQGFITVSQPETFEGLQLPKPTIIFGKDRKVNWDDANKRGPETDFMAAGQFYEPAKLSNWEVVFVQGEGYKDAIPELMSTMRTLGMSVSDPAVSFIVGGNLRVSEDMDRNKLNHSLQSIFQNAQKAKREMIVMITKARYNYHQDLKALEQEFQILTQEIQYETAEKLSRQANTKKNIVNKINVKLGGLNYIISTPSFQRGKLVVGFETSAKGGGGGGDFPIAIGYAANMGQQFQKFSGGYVFANRDKDIYGSVLKKIMISILNKTKNNGVKPEDIVIYFNGITEGQYALMNEYYSQLVKEACATINSNFKPHITLVASSKTHNERFYKADQKGVSNLDPCTIIDKVVVSPLLNEFYLASAVARQGTVKTTKYTVVFTTKRDEPLYALERLTNDLCFLHEIIFHPVGLPAPLYIAGSSSERGAKVLAYHSREINKENLEDTNARFSYLDKPLESKRFNA